MPITHIHHVSLIVADTAKALTFYRDLLGLTAIPRPELGFPGAWLQVGEQQIHLLELPNPDPVSGRPRHGGRDRHTAFRVEELAELEQRLQQAAVPFTRSRSGRAALFCRDPDGNGVELIGDSPLAGEITESAANLLPGAGFFMDQIVNAFYFNEGAAFDDPRAFICIASNRILLCSDDYGGCVDDNEDVVDPNGCIPLPHKNELDLGKRLVFNFAREIIPNDLHKVERMFSRRGAYRRFKAYLEEKDILERWYDYENTAQETALRAWCEWNQIPLKD